MSRAYVSLLAAVACLATTAPASGQVYRWTDERGVVNYGNKPPPNARNVAPMREDDGRVSTIPGMSPQTVEAERDRLERRRADQLQRDLEAERRASRAASGGGSDFQAWREQCLAERRVDCDDPNRGAFVPGPGWASPGYPVYPVPPIARPPGPGRPWPVPPQQQQPWPAPGGPVVQSPPVRRDPLIRGDPGQAIPR
jgi:hypothetical protein